MTKYNISVFYNDILSSKYVDTDPELTHYMKLSNEMIIKAFEMNRSMKRQIDNYKMFCEVFSHRRKNKLKVSTQDHKYFMCCLYALIKLKQLSLDDCLIYTKQKRKKKVK